MTDIAKHIIFKGRVQGVGFRFTTQRIVSRYDLTGFVKNLPNGSVELFIQGNADTTDECQRDIAKAFAGYVTDTAATDCPIDNSYTNFNIAF